MAVSDVERWNWRDTCIYTHIWSWIYIYDNVNGNGSGKNVHTFTVNLIKYTKCKFCIDRHTLI